jgi:hypothetical protein
VLLSFFDTDGPQLLAVELLDGQALAEEVEHPLVLCLRPLERGGKGAPVCLNNYLVR